MYKKYRKGVFCVVYAINKKPVYLLLHRIWHWRGWEFCKGGKKRWENLEENAMREVREETGLNALNLKAFPIKGSFLYDKKTQRERKAKGFRYKLFSCEVKKGRVKICRREHDSYKWLPYGKALKLLTWPNQKKCLKIVNGALMENIKET